MVLFFLTIIIIVSCGKKNNSHLNRESKKYQELLSVLDEKYEKHHLYYHDDINIEEKPILHIIISDV